MPEITGSSDGPENKDIEPVGSTDSSKPVANGAPENGVSSTSPEKKSPEKSEYEVLLAQGKRHLFVKDYPNAVALLGDACAKMSEMFGELADECADAYFCYGRALLELAREESNVLGTEPEKEDSDEGDEEGEKEEDDEKVVGEAEEKEKEESGEAEAKPDEGEEKKMGSEQNEEKDSPADETIDTTKEVNEDEEGEEKEEDVDNLQLAWEVLELAKKIFERQKSDAKLAETYLYLGEVGLESENYSGAIDDMKRCVEIQKQILSPDHREIAETYFQMGVACSLCNEFDQAIENFKCSSEILETRIKNLRENGAPKVEIEKNPFYSVDKEVEEIKALLPEIKVKIADMEDFKQETIKSMMAAIKGEPQGQSSDGAGPSSSSVAPVANGSPVKPATNISHLVRKKRKPEEDISSDSAVKKSCSEQVEK